MMRKTEYRSLSGVSRNLLRSDEADHLDFKETVESVNSEDFVAFANTKGGGSILIGVREKTQKNGLTKHQIVGCDQHDSAKLSLLEKAHSCRPPIPITIITENLNAKPFLRVTIPESPHKPHCTEKGLYKMRKGPRNAPLVPEHLLDLFLETQGKAFVERFSDASIKIEAMLEEIQNHVQSVTGLIFGEIGELSEQVRRQLQNISDMADTTTGLAEDANADNQTTLETFLAFHGTACVSGSGKFRRDSPIHMEIRRWRTCLVASNWN